MAKTSVVVRGAYGYDSDAASDAVRIFCRDESLTIQSEKEEADINTIVKRFGLTGQLPQGVRPPMTGDFTEALDYKASMDVLIEANNAFMAMPWDVRKRFGNDPAAFVDFCSDPKNIDEMRELGLAVPEAKRYDDAGLDDLGNDNVRSSSNVGASRKASGGGSGAKSKGARGSEGAQSVEGSEVVSD